MSTNNMVVLGSISLGITLMIIVSGNWALRFDVWMDCYVVEHIGKGRRLDAVYNMHFVFITSNNCSLSSGHCASFTELITGENPSLASAHDEYSKEY